MLTLFRSDPLQQAAELAYRRVVDAARRPGFFLAGGGVPDTVDGRFELICLHAFLYLHRLKREHPRGTALGQRFFDAMFTDFDRSLREMGTGDLSVGREIRRMAEAFYGRVAAYEAALDAGDPDLAPALTRNLYGTAPATPAQIAAMTAYIRREAASLDRQEATRLMAGDVAFGAPPPSSEPQPHQP